MINLMADKEKYRNPDGTYNGPAYMAELSGLSIDEVRWTCERIKKLLAEGKSKKECLAIVKSENPWRRK